MHTGHVLEDVRKFISRFVVLSEAQAAAITLWILHTHALDAADTTPYLSITSAEKRSGKTRLLEVLDLLVPKPWFTGRTTAAALSRKIDDLTPTLLLDESDAAFRSGSEYAETLRGILNTGFRRGGKVTVCVAQGSAYSYVDFQTFCPKAIAGIGSLPDTISDRSIVIQLERRTRAEPVERFRRRQVEAESLMLRDRITDWAAPNIDALREMQPALPEQLDDRAQDVWEPLLAVADLAEGRWPARARSAARELSSPAVREEESLGIRLLADIRRVFETQGTDRIRSSDLAGALAGDTDAPWSNWYGKPISNQSIGKLLKPYGIRTMEIWVDRGKHRGYRRDRFEPVWDRYLGAEEVGTVEGVDRPARQSGELPAPTTPTEAAQYGGSRSAHESAPSTAPTSSTRQASPTDSELLAAHQLDLSEWPGHERRLLLRRLREAEERREAGD